MYQVIAGGEKIMNKKEPNRMIILIALAMSTFATGGVYAWSVLSGPLAEAHGWDYGAVTLAYSILLLMLSVAAIPGGKALDVFGAKKTIAAAGVLWAAGWFLTGFVSDLWMLYVTIGIIAPIGSGFCYGPCITVANRWFPDKPGLASGVTVGATGLASLFLAPFASKILTASGVPAAFRALGILFAVIMVVPVLLFVRDPEKKSPAGAAEGRKKDPADTVIAESSKDTVGEKASAASEKEKTPVIEKDWRGMLRDPRFYFLWLIFLGGSVSGLMLISHASAIGQTVAGITPSQAALLVGIMAVVNFLGRIGMGSLSDKIGQFPGVVLCLAVSTVDMILMSRASSFPVFIASLIILCVCFGGTLSIFPGIVYRTFGMKNGGMNYGIIFTAYGIAAFIGPLSATKVVQRTGTYAPAFVIAGIFAAISLILTLLFIRLYDQKAA